VRSSSVANKKNRDTWLILIGSIKVLKAVLLIALGVGAIGLLHGNVADHVERWVRRLNVDAKNPFFQTFPEKIQGLSPSKISMVSAGAFVYAGLFLTEGVGLLMRKRWGKIFTIIITGSFLPIEIYELAVKEFSVFKLLLLLGNAAVLVYLIWRLKHEKKKGGSEDLKSTRCSPSCAGE
jgi:uncharacterized membrane protein (DUF2068 family)